MSSGLNTIQLREIVKSGALPPHRLLLLAKILLNKTQHELVRLTVADLYREIRLRFPASMRKDLIDLVDDLRIQPGLAETDFIVKSRNYKGRYAVSRQSVWRWLKGSELIQKLWKKKIAGVLSAIAVLAATILPNLFAFYQVSDPAAAFEKAWRKDFRPPDYLLA